VDRDPVFTALTRPQMFAGVTYSYFVVNMILAMEGFLIFRSASVLLFAAFVHGAGVLLCLREPRIVELWVARVARCPRVRNYALWQCNSYRP
jgi:type IV secretion system protein VirB3